ncbi:hypothetical protein DEI92_11270 [Curtobacterium sp. MCBD17_034]|uniref:DUF418 domain-containing protein n=1 Tax=unclassified Curtobacterium TaxID=257496 RepID=UPI000DA79BBD|nr:MULTISPECIES: DUF418 domain-containing protein [unclassified Curtobacterium]PZF58619.1 hypothetical protein DEI92_11270 [Curtobacterium sp. MCBD17_034]PZM34609.1 hypothetical protein DEI90_07840 [Curtobacterium sp. MCBD17_031]
MAPSGGRLVGVDLARALALAGMVVAHVGAVSQTVAWSDPSTWSAVVNGRSSALFALLAGVSVALVTGRTRPFAPPAMAAARIRLVVRAVLLVALGVLLVALGTSVAVILPTYGALFLLVVPVLRCPRSVLLSFAAGAVALSVPVALATAALFAHADAATAQFGRTYPVLTFLGFLLVGLAVGRSDLPARRTQVLLVVTGTALAVAAYTVGAVVAPVDPAVAVVTGVPSAGGATGPSAVLQEWLSPRAHSSSVVDVLGSTGVAVAVLGACLLLTERRARLARIVWPAVAVGSMPLSVYALHIVAIAVLAHTLGPTEGPAVAASFLLGAVLVAVLWRHRFRRGPLEMLLAAATAGPR